MSDKNLLMIAKALGELRDRVFFVGASVNTILVDPASQHHLRQTNDVDAVANISTYEELIAFEQKLQKKGFNPSGKTNDPACRWYFRDIPFDLIPIVPVGPHTSNIWYKSALNQTLNITLTSEINIRVINPIYFIATKLEAFRSRGDCKNLLNSDPDVNHDLEDIILLIDGRITAPDTTGLPNDVKIFIQDQLSTILSHANFSDYVFNCLSGPQTLERFHRIKTILEKMAGN